MVLYGVSGGVIGSWGETSSFWQETNPNMIVVKNKRIVLIGSGVKLGINNMANICKKMNEQLFFSGK